MQIHLPEDRDIERSVIGSAFASHKNAVEVCQRLTEDDFFSEPFSKIFSVISDTIQNGDEVDPLVVAKGMGGDYKSVILDALAYYTHGSSLDEQISLLKRLSVNRSIVRICTTVAANAASSDDAGAAISYAISSLMGIQTDNNHREYNLVSLIDDRLAHANEPEDFFEIDGFSGLHFFAGDMFVIGGRPGSGKTAFAMNMALEWAKKAPVRFYSYEMTERQLADRILSSMTGISVEQIEDGIDQSTVDTALSFMDDDFMNKDLTVRVSAGMTNAELFADMYKYAAAGGKVAIVDYIQLAADKTSRGLTSDVTMFSNRLRRVALDTGLLVVALAQLNRQVEERGSIKLPIMSDIRESGTIEQDATQICMLTSVPNPRLSNEGANFVASITNDPRMEFSHDMLDAGTGNPDDDPVLVVADFVKVRQGKRRRWLYIFDGACMRFRPLRRTIGRKVNTYVPTDSQDAAEMRDRLC